MTQEYNGVVVALTGVLPLVLIVSALLAFPISLALLKLYRNTVLKHMRARGQGQTCDPTPQEAWKHIDLPVRNPLQIVYLSDAIPLPDIPAVRGLYDALLRRPLRAAMIYVLAGCAYALVIAAAYLVASHAAITPLRLLVFSILYAWPLVFTLQAVEAAIGRIKLATVGGYFLLLALLGLFAFKGSPARGLFFIATLWAVIDLPATVLLLPFLNRRVRAVGPLTLTIIVLAVAGSQVVVSTLRDNKQLLLKVVEVGLELHMSPTGMFWGVQLLGFAVFGLFGWWAVGWIRRGYERKQISDQSLMLDTIWLLFAIVQSLELVFDNPLWILVGPGAFLLYKAIASVGFAGVNAKTRGQNVPTLLFLRVFALNRRSEQLFGRLAAHWRHVGSLRFICGPDLAAATVQPHAFLDFLIGKLRHRFIDGALTLDYRMATLDRAPDHDGRYRAHDFLCFDDTWKMVLARLVEESDAVLMDLRGFTPHNAGCVFELHELIDVLPLERVVFVVDGTTDIPFLHYTVQQGWSQMQVVSPNRRSAQGQLRLFPWIETREDRLYTLLRALCIATAAP